MLEPGLQRTAAASEHTDAMRQCLEGLLQMLQGVEQPSHGPCCPPDSSPFLPATHTPKGKLEWVGVLEAQKVETYVAPATTATTTTTGIVIFGDIWGYNSGRTLAVADAFAEMGYFVVVPKLLTPAFEGGTDGDGMPGSQVAKRENGWMAATRLDLEWFKRFPWATQKSKVAAVFDWLQMQGIEKVGTMGFCYGGHVACWASAEHPEFIAASFVCHPSIHVENLFGGDALALIRSVKCPFFIAPASSDLRDWADGSDSHLALKASSCGGQCVLKSYPDMIHGWSIRGDLSDPTVARDVQAVMEDASRFFATHLS